MFINVIIIDTLYIYHFKNKEASYVCFTVAPQWSAGAPSYRIGR